VFNAVSYSQRQVLRYDSSPIWHPSVEKTEFNMYKLQFVFCGLQPALCGCGVTKGCKFSTLKSTHKLSNIIM